MLGLAAPASVRAGAVPDAFGYGDGSEASPLRVLSSSAEGLTLELTTSQPTVIEVTGPDARPYTQVEMPRPWRLALRGQW